MGKFVGMSDFLNNYLKAEQRAAIEKDGYEFKSNEELHAFLMGVELCLEAIERFPDIEREFGKL